MVKSTDGSTLTHDHIQGTPMEYRPESVDTTGNTHDVYTDLGDKSGFKGFISNDHTSTAIQYRVSTTGSNYGPWNTLLAGEVEDLDGWLIKTIQV